MSFGQCHRGKSRLCRQNLTTGISAVADAAQGETWVAFGDRLP
jgi:hypothetical protein